MGPASAVSARIAPIPSCETAVTGIFYPLGLQNAAIQAIGQALPLYWLGLGMRSALLPNDIAQVEIEGSWRTVETALALRAWTVVATLIALYALRRMTHRTSGSRASLLRRRRDRARSAPSPAFTDSQPQTPAIRSAHE